jgi:hypothetical protein
MKKLIKMRRERPVANNMAEGGRGRHSIWKIGVARNMVIEVRTTGPMDDVEVLDAAAKFFDALTVPIFKLVTKRDLPDDGCVYEVEVELEPLPQEL